MTYSAAVLHDRFELSDQGDAVLYGRVAAAADCATLRVPAAERAVCPSPRVAASFGVDGLVNNPDSPAYTAPLPAGISHADATKRFSYAVLEQQPLRVAGAIAKDAVKLFALTRDTAPGDTPVWRWQFQTTYPTFPPTITLPSASALFRSTGGGAAVAVPPLAAFLRGYQLHGGYTPGPYLLLSLLAGVAGAVARPPAQRHGRAGLPAHHRRGRRGASGGRLLRVLMALPAPGPGDASGRRCTRGQRAPGPGPPGGPAEGCCRDRTVSGSNVGQVPSEREQPDIRTLESRVVYQDSWIRLRQDRIERRDGSRGTYAVVEKPDFALVIPAENDGFHLVEEYRYPIRRRSWSFPQGGFPAGAAGTPADLARLELSQETGLRARELTPLGFLHCAHGTTDQGCHIFLATGLQPGTPDREPEEQDMRQQWIPRARFGDMVREGVITDDSTLAAFALLLLHEKHSG